MPQLIKAIAFDAYGTLFDVHSVAALAEAFYPDAGVTLSEIWRVAQIDYTRMRTLGDQYVNFRQVTEDGLVFAAEKLGLALGDEQRKALMAQYEHLTAYPEVQEVLESLKERGMPIAILSNGTPDQLETLVAHAGLTGLFDHLLSIDTVGRFKPTPEAYSIGPAAFGCPASEIGFVSSNGWDVCGATWYGYKAFWVNRAGNPLDKLGVRPAGEGRNLRDLLAYLRN